MGVTRVTELYGETILDNSPSLSVARVTELYGEVILYNGTDTESAPDIRIDLNNDGDFDDANEDVTAYVKSYRIETGGADPQTGQALIGQATLVLRNDTNLFSPLNSSSALYPNLKRGRPLRIRRTFLGTTYTRFLGIIDEITPDPDKTIQECTIVALDAAARLERAPSSSSDWQGANLKTIVANLLTDAGWTAATNIDVAADAPPFVQIAEGDPVLSTLSSLAETEGGRFYVTHDGTFRYESRHYRRRAKQSVYCTFTASDLQPDLETSDLLKDVTTAVKVSVSPLAAGPIQEVWTHQQGGIYVGANSSAIVYAEFAEQVINLQAPTVANEDYDARFADASGSATGSLTVTALLKGRRAKITLTNAHATKALRVSPLRLRGQPVTTMEQHTATALTAEEQAARNARRIRLSIETTDAATGLGTIPVELSPFYTSSVTFAQALAQEHLDRGKVERKVLSFTVKGNDTPRLANMLGLTVSDRIRVTYTPQGLDKQAWVTRWTETAETGQPVELRIEAVEAEANQTCWQLGASALSASPTLVNF